MASCVTFKHISEAQVGELHSVNSPDAVRSKLGRWWGYDAEATPSKTLLDMFFYTYAFAKEQHFSPMQTACLLSIAREVVLHDVAQGFASVEDSFGLFKTLLLRHSIERPPQSSGIFDQTFVKPIIGQVIQIYYRVFKLFKYLLVPQTSLVLQQTNPGGVETPRVFRPLREMLPMVAF